MDNISISINTAYTQTPAFQKEPQLIDKTSPSEQNTNLSTQSDRTEISEQAKEKQLQDSNQQAHRKLMGKAEPESVEDADEKSILDEMIEKLQEKIAKLMQEMSELRLKGGEQSSNEAKVLEVKIASLTAQLMELLTQKNEQAENQ